MNKRFLAAIFFLVLSALLIYKNPVQRNPASATPREGIFIGSFDPFTKGHMSVVLASIKDLSLDKIHIQVNSLSNKDYAASIGERIELIKKALAHYPMDVEVIIEAEPVEGKRKFVQNLHEKTGADIYQVMGADVLEKSDELFGDLPYVKRFVARRLEDDSLQNIEFKDNKLPSSVSFLNVKAKGISSTKVKELLKVGEVPYAYLESSVIDTIMSKNLYEFPGQSTMEIKKIFFTEYYKVYMSEIKKKMSGLSLPAFSETQNVQFTWSQSNEGFLEQLIRVVLKNNKELSLEERAELWSFSRKIYHGDGIQNLVRSYESDVREKSNKAKIFLSSFEEINEELRFQIAKVIDESNHKIIIAIEANYLRASSIPEARERKIIEFIEENYPDSKNRFEVVVFENGEKPTIVEKVISRRFDVEASVHKITTKRTDDILDFKYDDSLLKNVEQKLLKQEEEIRFAFERLKDEGYSLNDLKTSLENPSEKTADFIKEWERRNISYQARLDEYYAYNFDYQIVSSMNEFQEAMNNAARLLDRRKRGELLKLKERLDTHFSLYFLNKENYGAKKDVLRVDHLQGYFKSLRAAYLFMQEEPVLSLKEKFRYLNERLGRRFSSLVQEVKLLPEMVNLLFTYYVQKSKSPEDAVVALNRYFKKKSRTVGVDIKIYDDLSILKNKDEKVVTIFTPNHVQGDLDGMIMGELQRDNSLLFAARSRLKWRQRLFDQVPDSNLIVVGGEIDPVEDVLEKIKKGNSNEVYIYPEGHFAGMTGETRVPKVGFSAGFLRKLKMEGISYQVVPLTFHGSAGVVGEVGKLKGRELSVSTGHILDERMTQFLDQQVRSRTFYNTFVRANWLKDHSLTKDNIHGSPSVKKLKLILGKYNVGDIDSCYDVMKSLLSI